MTDAKRDLLEQAIEALAEAASEDQPIRFGADVVRVVHGALLDATEPPAHRHEWQALGYEAAATAILVIQHCACGAARTVTANASREGGDE